MHVHYLFMFIKPKCNFNFQWYDILVIFRFLCELFFATRIRIRLHPGSQNVTDPTGSGSTSLVQIHYLYH